jgi:D-arabinose 1-dehydrogenase-like Zn-dependent alcohol dehydrogenase
LCGEGGHIRTFSSSSLLSSPSFSSFSYLSFHCANLPLSSQAAKYPDGVQAQGGYSTGIIAHEQYVFPIPDAIKSEDAASMVCAGLTVYSPLTRHGAGPGKKVGIIGVGGLVSRYVLFIDEFLYLMRVFNCRDTTQ